MMRTARALIVIELLLTGSLARHADELSLLLRAGPDDFPRLLAEVVIQLLKSVAQETMRRAAHNW
jgi:hypothetical protein